MTQLEKYYGKFKEDHRLTTRHGRVEFLVSMEKIRECARSLGKAEKDVKILDVGAGTGRYSVALAESGFDVTAVELVKHNLDQLLAKHAKVKCWPGDARDLAFLESESFDITLLFGPMYHLHAPDQRLKALNEAKRVTKAGGFILVAYLMNEYAVVSYCFRSRKILECFGKSLTDDFHTVTKDGEDLYSYTRIEDINKLNEESGLERVKIFAPDGPADYIRRELNALSEEEFEIFVEYQKSVCERPELLGASSHTVDILKKCRK